MISASAATPGNEGCMKRVYGQLREDITFGKFKPGEHLSERFLTQTYGVSRVTIREVIGQLATQGYLTVEKNRGATVTKLSLEDVDVIYNILVRCESYAARLFANRPLTPVIRELEVLHARMQAEQTKLSHRVWLQLNDDFHRLIHSNCGSAILSDLIFHTRYRIYRFRVFPTEPNAINSYDEDHQRILSAIRRGNGQLTEELMAGHLEAARNNRIKILKEFSELL
jgi:DNA-binding GntR family transcriptional regulator